MQTAIDAVDPFHDESRRGDWVRYDCSDRHVWRVREGWMFESAWIEISPRERLVLLDALAVLGESRSINAAEVDALAVKLVHTPPHPKITIGIQSGQVQ